MTQSRGAKGKSAGRRRGKHARLRRPPKPARDAASLVDDQKAKIEALARELAEAREQQAATSDVLDIINRSTFQLQPVLDAIVQTAGRLCQAEYAVVFRLQDGLYRPAAANNAKTAFVKYLTDHPIAPGRGTLIGRTALERQVVHLPDCLADPEYTARGYQRVGKHRSMLGVPLLRDGAPIGAIGLMRNIVKPFTDKQIELVQNFAAQAVVAIENARLLTELRQRTGDLSEALEQQTATSEVLQVISSSPGDLVPVFNSILANARRICDAKFAHLMLYDGELFHPSAMEGAPPAFVTEFWRGPQTLSAATGPGRAVATKQVVHIPDMQETEAYKKRDPQFVAMTELTGARAVLIAPMLKDDRVIGTFSTYRQEARPFTGKQIELARNFAAQAVIAIENTRLLNELRESLQQQTATSDVLEVISRAAFDLQAVFETVAESSVKLCGADRAFIFRFDGELLQMVTSFNSAPEFTEWVRQHPIRPGRHSGSARAALERRTIHIPDVLADPDYSYGAKNVEAIRTILGVPILKGDELLGVMMIYRLEVKPFTDKQIALVETFADQAAIAIENVRLFDEIRETSRQLAEASQHKSQFLANMSHELRTPLNAILGYTELILDGIYGETPDKAQVVLKRVESNGKHLLGLINDVLDFSKIEAGQLRLAISEFSMKDVVYNVYSAVEPLAAKKNLKFSVEVPPDMPPGQGDERKLTQVLLNLVGNAIKFTDSGEVAIKVAPANGSLSVAVHDTGPGIPKDNQEKMFEEFQQADNSITKAKGGTGLGLAISRRIVELHGGRLWVESSPGRGSVFTFEIPSVTAQSGAS